ncbi:hypothetical protein M119_4912 [Bacteroides fragilis str. 3783N1-6]|uniref:Uncharacterized protein n=1 Tax=Bacteroides fragilis str. 3783N1-6 TaxID=1339310 RepID=A0AB73ARW9_BACFG|nr:hypothetical protein M121_4176 [Bacteroides fragilis str. 3783N2-1]EXY53317.1 hypothetical protein M122_4721 [Bacteroides fragilis str. 3976T7]EXZ70719.1 hypothetical protein M120_5175 [Bacteroides fragilis str. 3783N1-8]EYB11965.1 hypothetical protein M119_4912 [Bacteroides fragilis str. 3783N1-6]
MVRSVENISTMLKYIISYLFSVFPFTSRSKLGITAGRSSPSEG